MGNICIIPARGGSKRIPRKNIKLFHGKPIISYSIEAALSSKLFDVVMVSTDDIEIAEIAIQYGAEVPFFRSEQNANDFATTFDVVHEVIMQYKKQGVEFDYGCCVYACAPFVSHIRIIESYQLLKDKNYDSVFPIIPFGFPIQRALKIDTNNRVFYFQPEHARSRSQDLEKSYHDAGQYYWFNVKNCMNYKAIITINTGSIVISELEGQDIDNETDWSIAELKFALNVN
jgi:pseudaminic acid cytidylyltransferase